METACSIGLGFAGLLDHGRSKISATPKRARDVPYTRSRLELSQAPVAFAPVVQTPIDGDRDRNDPAVAFTAFGFAPVGGAGHRHAPEYSTATCAIPQPAE